MTAVHNFIDVGDPAAPIGTPAWCKAAHLQLCATKRQTDMEVRHLKYGLKEFKERERWRQLETADHKPFASWDEYVRHPEPSGLGMLPDNVNKIIEAADDSSMLGDILGKHGGDRRSAEARTDQGDNITLKERGTSRDYIIARLERDRPDLAEKVIAGEMSARAAAIEAGFQKRSTPFEKILKLLDKLSPVDLDELENEIAKRRK